MSEQVSWLVEVAIEPGQFAAFQAIADDLIAATQGEPGTLSYEWNLNSDRTICHIYERYRDSAAVLIHCASFGRFAERFLQTCRPVRLDVYGSPTAEARAALADLHPTFYFNLGGFTR